MRFYAHPLQVATAIKPDNSEQHWRDLLEAKSEILKLRAQLKRTEEERDILKNPRGLLQGCMTQVPHYR